MTSPDNSSLRFTGSVITASGILLGAFGAHALKSVLPASSLDIWHTAVEYQLWNGVGLVGLGGWQNLSIQRFGRWIPWGIVLFSGSLYALALTGQHVIGAVTPIGGLLMLVGWFGVAWQSRRKPL